MLRIPAFYDRFQFVKLGFNFKIIKNYDCEARVTVFSVKEIEHYVVGYPCTRVTVLGLVVQSTSAKVFV